MVFTSAVLVWLFVFLCVSFEIYIYYYFELNNKYACLACCHTAFHLSSIGFMCLVGLGIRFVRLLSNVANLNGGSADSELCRRKVNYPNVIQTVCSCLQLVAYLLAYSLFLFSTLQLPEADECHNNIVSQFCLVHRMATCKKATGSYSRSSGA